MKTLLVAGANPETRNLGWQVLEILKPGYDKVVSWSSKSEPVLEPETGDHDLICSIGRLEIGLLRDKKPELVLEEVVANLIAPLALVQDVLKMKGTRRVVMIGSMAYRKALTGYSVYAACKAGIAAAVQNIAYENAKDLGFRIWTVAPGTIESTPIATKTASQTAVMKGKYTSEILQEMKSTFPTGKMVDPAAVAAAIKFCFSGQADQMNGHCFEISNNQR